MLSRRRAKLRLGSPGATGLPVAGRLASENAPDVRHAGRFAPLKLLRAFEEAEMNQILRRSRMHAVPVGVVADGMLLQRFDDIAASALFQDPRLLPHHLEGCVHTRGRQLLGNP